MQTLPMAEVPYVLSASRRTDVPAFYMNEFARRFRSGEFGNVGFIVFWSKNPEKLLKTYPVSVPWYLQYSLNFYDIEGYEPHIPFIEKRIDTFKRLVDKFGKRILWRNDPLLLSDRINIDELLVRHRVIAEKLDGYTDRCTFSFIDNYGKAARKMAENNIRCLTVDEQHTVCDGLLEIHRFLRNPMRLMTCAEAIQHEGIEHAHCIDAELIEKLSGNVISGLIEDPRQRRLCGCVKSHDMGEYRTCKHGCVYCYAM